VTAIPRAFRTIALASVVALQGCTGGGKQPTPTSRSSSADAHTARGFTKCADATDSSCRRYDPSLTELIARPESYDGRPVAVAGVLSYGFEDTALYISAEAYEEVASRSAVALRVSKEACSGCQAWRGQWVNVVGTYRAGDWGHMGGYSGTITDVSGVYKRQLSRASPPVPVPDRGGR
jgi:hypothetical protein